MNEEISVIFKETKTTAINKPELKAHCNFLKWLKYIRQHQFS